MKTKKRSIFDKDLLSGTGYKYHVKVFEIGTTTLIQLLILSKLLLFTENKDTVQSQGDSQKGVQLGGWLIDQ